MKTEKLMLGAASVGVSLVLGAFAPALATPTDPRPATPRPALSQLPADLANGGVLEDCKTCHNCLDPSRHSLGAGGPNWDRAHGELNHTCTSAWAEGTCSDRHPESGNCTEGGGGFEASLMDVEELEELWVRLVAAEGTEGLMHLLAASGSTVSYHPARDALQVQGCDGRIAWSIPLTDARVPGLTQ